jgi:hypothetical protein
MNQRERPTSTDAPPRPVPDLKRLLSRLLISGGVLLTGLVVTLALTLILRSSGDDAGARAIGYVVWVAAGCFAIIMVALLSSVTLAVLQLLDRVSDPSEPTSPPASRRSDADSTADSHNNELSN